MYDNGTFIPDRFTHNGELASFTLEQMNARPHPDAYYHDRIEGLPPRKADPVTAADRRKPSRGVANLGRPIPGDKWHTDLSTFHQMRAAVAAATHIARDRALSGESYRSYLVLPDGSIHFLATPQDYIDAREITRDFVGDCTHAGWTGES